METQRTDKRKFHFIYKTTCLVTGRWYIGMHSTDLLEDGYLGSGKRLWYSIKKYGEENHSREIVEFCSDRKSLAAREKDIVNEDMLKEEQCMNLKVGGDGGGGFWNKEHLNKMSIAGNRSAAKRKRSSEVFSQVVSRLHGEGKYQYDNFKGKVHSEETKAKMRESHKGLQNGEKNSQFGKCWMTDGKISKSVKPSDVDELLLLGWSKGRKIKK